MRLSLTLTKLALTALTLASGPAFGAPTATIFASDLLNPNKIILGPAGTFLVTETGLDPNTGRVSRLNSSGLRTTLVDGLPSGLAAPNNDADGPNGLVLQGNTLYIAIGEGDSLVNGSVAGTNATNPKGPSSPALDCVLQVVFSASVDRLSGGFKLQSADHFTLIEGNPVVLTNTANEQATVTMLSAFRTVPDARLIYRNSHPYGLVQFASDPGSLYMVDAGLNSLIKIDAQNGRARTITKFANVPNLNTTTGPPTAEAVPDSVRVYGNMLLVTLLTGFPFAPGDSRVIVVDPATGNSGLFISLLSSAIDVLFRVNSAGRAQFFVLEYSGNQLASAPGRLKLLEDPVGTVLVDGLKTPTNMALDAASGTMYITQRGEGNVVKVDVGQ